MVDATSPAASVSLGDLDPAHLLTLIQ